MWELVATDPRYLGSPIYHKRFTSLGKAKAYAEKEYKGPIKIKWRMVSRNMHSSGHLGDIAFHIRPYK